MACLPLRLQDDAAQSAAFRKLLDAALPDQVPQLDALTIQARVELASLEEISPTRFRRELLLVHFLARVASYVATINAYAHLLSTSLTELRDAGRDPTSLAARLIELGTVDQLTDAGSQCADVATMILVQLYRSHENATLIWYQLVRQASGAEFLRHPKFARELAKV